LKEEIISGDIPPGGVIHEVVTAARFQVSKSPVRDALGLLRAEGYVQTIPHRGYVASDVSLRDFNEVFEVRALLEAEAAALAARRATPEVLTRLDDLLRSAQAAEASGTHGEYVHVNREFHLSIAAASGNSLLRRLIEQLLDRAERAIALGVQHRPSPEGVYEETAAIIAAIRTRDVSVARRAMWEHIESMRRRLLALGGEGE
jgi:DNA-binding GntR family transcriptional regulator